MAQKVPGVNEKPAPLKKIGILGAGLMGGGIAMCFVQKGVPVVLKDAKQEWLDDGMKKIQGLWGGQAKRGRLSQDKYKQYMSLLKPTLDYADFKDVDMVIEAVPEIMDLKKQVFLDIEKNTKPDALICTNTDFKDVDMVIEAVPEIMDLKKQVFLDIEKNTKPDALICTNTSGLNIDDIAAVLKDPSRVMGTHFFSPANLLENVRTSKSSTKTLATGMAMGKLISKKAIMVGNCDGFVGNRMLAPYAGEAKMVLEEGASIEQVDAAAQKFGMAMGPMALGDLVGLELFWKQRKAAGDMQKQTKTYYGPYELTDHLRLQFVDWLCEQGRFGLKTPDPKIKANGRGVFIHRGRSKEVDPEVVAKLDEAICSAILSATGEAASKTMKPAAEPQGHGWTHQVAASLNGRTCIRSRRLSCRVLPPAMSYVYAKIAAAVSFATNFVAVFRHRAPASLRETRAPSSLRSALRMSASISVRPDGVGVLTMSSPPVNSLGTSLVTSFKRL
eukprot:s10202_g1.t1